MSDALIREVHEDLQRDRALALAKRYGGYVAGLAFLVIAGTAAYVGWESWQAGVRAEESAKLFAAMSKLDSGQAAAAQTEFQALAADSSDGVAAIARLQAAEAALRDAKPGEASEILGNVASSPGVDDQILKEAAQIAVIGRRLDDTDPQALITELQPLTGADRPFRHQAREFLGLAQIRAGDLQAAKTTFDDAIKDPSLPGGARARLSEYRAALEAAA